MIYVYNRNKESHQSHPNNFPIYRPTILGNPYTHIKDRETKAAFVVATREEAIERYSDYFDAMYSGNVKFKAAVDEIYEKYKAGEDIFLECFCAPLKCHGDIIASKLRSRRIKELLKEKKHENII